MTNGKMRGEEVTDAQKLAYILKVLKDYVELKHCYEEGDYYTPSHGSYDGGTMKLYRYKKDGHLYILYEQLRPFYNLVAVPYFPNQGILAKSKRSISMNDFIVVACY